METKNSWELSIPTGLHHQLKDHVMVSGTFYVYVHVCIIQYILCTSDVYHSIYYMTPHLCDMNSMIITIYTILQNTSQAYM